MLASGGRSVYYVKPENASNFSCPDQPCLTLDQYAENTSIYFTTGATFVFLPGNHSMQSTMKLKNISNITLRGTRQNSTTPTPRWVGLSIHCRDVRNLSIEQLMFDQWFFIGTHMNPAAALVLFHCEVIISDCTFKGRENTSHTVRASQSKITITRSRFEANNVINNEGGAIYVTDGCYLFSSLIGNKARLSGGAIYVAWLC